MARAVELEPEYDLILKDYCVGIWFEEIIKRKEVILYNDINYGGEISACPLLDLVGRIAILGLCMSSKVIPSLILVTPTTGGSPLFTNSYWPMYQVSKI